MIDELDRKIIRNLGSDGRMSFRDLGERIHLSPNATAERVHRLRKEGVIRGFRAQVNWWQLGYTVQAYVDVRLRPETSSQYFTAVAAKIPGIVSLSIVTGDFDARLRVVCKDNSEFLRVIDALRARAGVQFTHSAVICQEIDAGEKLV